jgi:hypothetical protein
MAVMADTLGEGRCVSFFPAVKRRLAFGVVTTFIVVGRCGVGLEGCIITIPKLTSCSAGFGCGGAEKGVEVGTTAAGVCSATEGADVIAIASFAAVWAGGGLLAVAVVFEVEL